MGKRLLMAVVVSIENNHVSTGYSDHPFDDGPYSGYSHEVRHYGGCEVRYVENDNYGSFGYHSQKFDVDAKPGDIVFVIIAIYSDGGTFGRTDGYTEVLYVTKDIEKAIQLKKLLEKDAVENRNFSFNGNQIDFDGQSIYTGTWKGYFSGLDRFELETEIVK